MPVEVIVVEEEVVVVLVDWIPLRLSYEELKHQREKNKDGVVLLTGVQNWKHAKSLLTEMHAANIVRVSVRYMTSVG